MISINTKSFGTLLYAIMLSFLLLPNNIVAQKKKKKDKDETEKVESKANEKQKKKSIADLVKSSKPIEGLFMVYRDTLNGDLQMVISEDQIGKEYIHFAQIMDGVMDAGRIIRGSYRGSSVFKINKFYNRIEFIAQNTSFYFDPDNPISKSKDANISESILYSAEIVGYNDDNSEYLIKADDLFLKETLEQIKPASRPGTPATAFKLGNLDKTKSKILEVNNYPENLNTEVEYVYSTESVLNGGSNAVTDGRNVSIKVVHSLLAMPDNDYEIRLDDPRVGYFTTQVDDQTSISLTPYRDLIHRWHLKKKNPELALSEPEEPIVWWMENSTPIEWRETIKEAVLQWNRAFEKAGFKNAIVVKQQPDDAEWDAGDIRYNVLRWTSSPQPIFGGSGPSFVNPRTGQILGADVMLEYSSLTNQYFSDKLYESGDSNKSELNNNKVKHKALCNFAQEMHQTLMLAKTVAVLNDASDLELKRIQRESLLATIMHEVGHTLGLSHNMKASQLYTPEQLATPEFIKGKCLTASVMDYATLNITKDRSKQGQYNDVTIGPYDEWAIQFGYTPFKTGREIKELLDQSTKREHIFGNDADDMRSSSRGIDPRIMIFDQSSDAIKYSIDRMELVENLLSTAKDKFIKPGEFYEELNRVYRVLSIERANAARVISRYIGGVYVDRSMAGQVENLKPYTPVSLADQKRAMKALDDYVFAPDAFQAPNDFYNYLAKQRRGFDLFSGPEDPKIHQQILGYQKNVLKHLLHPNTLQRIKDSELYGNEYSLESMMTDLNNAIFKMDINANVNSFRQNLQLEYTNMLIDILTGKEEGKFSNNAKSMALYNLNVIKGMTASSGDISSKAHKQHLRMLIDNALEEIK